MASTNIKIPFAQFDNYLKQLGANAQKALNSGLLSAALRAQTIVVAETQKKSVFNTGYYQGAWKAERLPLPRQAIRVYNFAPYAGVIEEGRRPYPTRVAPRRGVPRRPKGSGPIPMDQLPPFRKAIVAWTMRKFSLPYEDAYPRMWAISNAINKRGIPAKRVLGDANPLITAAFREEVERELKRALGIP